MLTKLLTAVGGRPARPSRAEVEPVASSIVRRHGPSIMAVARRYAATPEDAEDAYQRGLEILLTKAPSVREDDLLPWLKTVVKHEAFSLYRKRERDAGAAPAAASSPSETHEQVVRLDQLKRGAEAMRRLKPAEVRCLLLRAEGHSYKQICSITGFSYTKVNRCLTEGRAAFVRGIERIESGAECERMAPLLSALADGEATARDMAVLRPHLRTCLTCRAALRDAREVPARVAALAPVGLALPGLRSLGDWLHERVLWLALRGQEAIEAASSHKLAAAAAASAAALGGGAGIATVELGGHGRHHERGRPPVQVVHSGPPAPRWRPAATVVAPPAREPRAPRRHRERTHRRTPSPASHVEPPTSPLRPAAPQPAAPAGPQHRGAADRAEPWTGEFGP